MFDFWALPIVKIILQKAVADAKFQFLQELVIFHGIQSVEHVELSLPRENERIVHQLMQGHRGCDVPI